jgi:cell division protein FtsL
MSARPEKQPLKHSPLVRVRQMAVVIAGIMALLIGPLLLVWKQAYIRSASVGLEAMAETLSTLDKEISLLRLKSERLSNNDRIETFAKVTLNLEYPSSDRMVIVAMGDTGWSRKSEGKESELFASVRLGDRFAKGGPQ